MSKSVLLDPSRPEIYENNYNHCLGLLTISDFLKLVRSLFEIDPSGGEKVRAMVQRVYSSNAFNKFFEVESI